MSVVNSQNSMISFDYSWFLAKNFQILYHSLENSTTGITIVLKQHVVLSYNFVIPIKNLLALW